MLRPGQALTERSIQQRFLWYYGWRSWISTNFTPCNWWECDLAQVTKAGYFREFEIKISRSDFFADMAKMQKTWVRGSGYVERRKHDLLAKGDPVGPVQFFYVCPKGLITLADLPTYAGLMEVDDRCRWFTTVKAAPRLHKTKAPSGMVDGMLKTAYYRSLRQAIASNHG